MPNTDIINYVSRAKKLQQLGFIYDFEQKTYILENRFFVAHLDVLTWTDEKFITLIKKVVEIEKLDITLDIELVEEIKQLEIIKKAVESKPKNPDLVLKFKTIVDTLNRELYKAKSEDLGLEDQLDIQEELKRLVAKSSDLTDYIDIVNKNLLDYAKDFEIDSRFKIGFREFEKVQESTNAKLDEIKLAEFVKDQDQLAEFYDKKPKNQTDVKKLLTTLGLNVDITQLYSKEEKSTYKIKFK